ncbi:MAG: hypothetical protein M3511_03600, partial [Deinococcota bacterium]|nr:hypothetical protein [Deinococcota bacterium]
MNSISPKRVRALLGRPLWRLLAVWLTFMLSLTALLYSVYGIAPAGSLVAGRPSPATYLSPFDMEVVNPLATERGRRQAGEQIATLYTVDPRVQRLVLDALAVSTLPAEAQTVVGEAFRRPEGVRGHELPAIIGRALGVTPQERRGEVRLVLERILMPSAQPNLRLTEIARAAATAAFAPVTEVLQAGQAIVREGEILTEDQLRVLEQVGLYNPQHEVTMRTVWRIAGSLALAVLLSLPLLYAYYSLRDKFSTAQFYFIGFISLVCLSAQRFALEFNPGFIFISLVALLVAVLVSERSALAWGAFLSLTVAFLAPALALPTLLATLTSTSVAALLAGRFKTRASLLIASAVASLAAAFSLTFYNVLSGNIALFANLTGVLWLLGGGLLAGLLALGLLPLAETNSIGFLTEFRLLELSNPSSPLLQRLMLEAPGSYQHSLI